MSNQNESASEVGTAFHSHLAQSLHAFAQPLAILRAKLYAESIARMDAAELQELALTSAGQVERLCGLFNYLQEIVLAESAEAQIMEIPLNEVIEHVVDGVELWFRDASLDLNLSIDEHASAVLADKAKLSQALSSALLLAHGLSNTGEAVLINVERNSDNTCISIANSTLHVSTLTAEARLGLALIETNLRKQHGTFSFSLQPLIFRAGVPNAPITT